MSLGSSKSSSSPSSQGFPSDSACCWPATIPFHLIFTFDPCNPELDNIEFDDNFTLNAQFDFSTWFYYEAPFRGQPLGTFLLVEIYRTPIRSIPMCSAWGEEITYILEITLRLGTPYWPGGIVELMCSYTDTARCGITELHIHDLGDADFCMVNGLEGATCESLKSPTGQWRGGFFTRLLSDYTIWNANPVVDICDRDACEP